MPSKGRAVPCPLGAKSTRKPRPAGPLEGSSRIVSEIEASGLRWMQNRNAEIEAAIAMGPAPFVAIEMDVDARSTHIEGIDYLDDDYEQDMSNHDLNEENFLPHPDGPAPQPNPTFQEYIQGSYYKRKQLVEADNWKKVLGSMFICYMSFSRLTSQWGNPQLWDFDYNDQCACCVGDLRTRMVDMVDILGRKQENLAFCKCTHDQVRLIRMGYIGGSPLYPQTAFSIRLLRFHHSLWKFCTVRIQGFALALDEFLDAFNPLILVPGSEQPRLWRRTLSVAIDAYRHMLRMEDELSCRALKLNPLDMLAFNCARCFGPLQEFDNEDEPHYIVCVDGNFQHRRHLAASREYEEKTLMTPSLFMDPKQVQEWESKGPKRKDESKLDPCTSSHTAAADHRSGTTWKSCDETGLIGMACRHDHILSYVNVVQTGERQYYVLAMMDQFFKQIDEAGKPKKRVALLYDIGCTLEKSLIKNKIFEEERERKSIKLGTSAFHSYVHNWACQLRYNPRLNPGFGLSDGEGLERNWSGLSPLVSVNRYATKQHRLDSISLKTCHRNKMLSINAVQSSSSKLCTAEKTLQEAKAVLERLQSVNIEYTKDYFALQWERQKHCQLTAMEDGSLQKLEEKLVSLLDFEEQLRDAHKQLSSLRKKRRRNRTDTERADLVTLPASIVEIEKAIRSVAEDLGNPEFRTLRKATNPKARALIQVRLAKMKLYEAKVGIIEVQKKWDRDGQGTKIQQSMKKVMTKKQLMFKKKWETYRTQVSRYNEIAPVSQLTCPTMDAAKMLPCEDPFWNVGALSHPSERWAIDPGTVEGIQSYLKYRSSSEEVCRIGRETHQMVLAALRTEEKIKAIQDLCNKEWDVDIGGRELIELVQGGQRVSKDVWAENVGVLRTLYENLCLSHGRKWLAWNSGVGRLLRNTRQYTQSSVEETEALVGQLGGLVRRAKQRWEGIVNAISVEASGLDDLEIVEQNMWWGEDGEDADINELMGEMLIYDSESEEYEEIGE